MRHLILFTLIILLISINAVAQQVRLSFDVEDVSMEQFATAIEKQSGYRFYFDEKDMAGFRISISVRNRNLRDVLSEVFSRSAYRFAIDQDNNVFITRERAVQTMPAWQMTSNSDSLFRYDEMEMARENKIYVIGIKTNKKPDGNATISGMIRDLESGRPLAGATIMADADQRGVQADVNGRFSITLRKGLHTLTVAADNKTPVRRVIELYNDGALSFELKERIKVLDEVIISAQRNSIVNRPQMGIERVTIKTIRQVPTALGEADLIKVLLTLPGVKSVGEASTGFNVRGGAADQNLILFNDATIYNPTHFFGFFSAFNPEIVKDVELFKSSIPVRYGGRLSSVLNITAREGNKNKLTGSAGIGLVTSRVNLEGPIVKEKTSFNVGGRTTYSNWLLKLLPDDNEYRNSSASFHDINVGIHHRGDKNNEIQLTAYYSKDKFNLNSDTVFGYSNANLSLKWRHVFSKKLQGEFTTGYDHYGYENTSDNNKINAYKMVFDISQFNIKADMSYYVTPQQTINFGLSSIKYQLDPGRFSPVGEESLVSELEIQRESGLESALYAGTRIDLSTRASVEAGFRYSFFNYLGSHDVNYYKPGIPRDESSMIETRKYSKGAFINTYHGPEFRISARYSLTDDLSVKAGFNTLRQYLHMLSNTTAISPTDIWKLSDPNIKPQIGSQLAVGIYKNFASDSLELSVEGYYKKMSNYLDYKSGATLVLNEFIERDALNTRGKAYGVEVMLRKRAGKLNGWLSYTYSRTLLKMDDEQQGVLVNRGEWYPSNYDKPHDVTFVGNYRINLRFSLSVNVTYSTGRPITLPIGTFWYGNSERALYSDRNAYRIPDYFRTDFSMNIEGNHKVKQLTHNSWTIGVYNLTGRKNPYSVYFTSENGVTKGYKLSIFGSIIPFVNYNIRF